MNADTRQQCETNRDPGRDHARWQSIAREPWTQNFFPFMRWLESTQPDKPRLGTARRPADEPVRLGQEPDLSFAPAALHAVELNGAAGGRPRIAVRFFGLFGPNGPLPTHLTEHARQRILQRGDKTFARFADLFHHRLLLLFYRAWAQGDATVSLDRPADDPFSRFAGSLAGLGIAPPPPHERETAPNHARLHFAGWLSKPVRSAEGLESILSGTLGREVRVESFAGRWMALDTEERTRIGRPVRGLCAPVSQLGRGAVLGASVWDRQHHFRLHVGPLDRAAFDQLLPGGALLPAAVALLDCYVGHELGWDLRLRLSASQVRPVRLGCHGSRLGWTSWLGSRPREHDAEVAVVPGMAVQRAFAHH